MPGSETDLLLRRLSPHLARSAGMRNHVQKLEQEQAIRQMELVLVPPDMVWTGADLKTVTANSRARDLLGAVDGLGIHRDCLRGWIEADTERLNLALAAAVQPGSVRFGGIAKPR